MMYHSSFCSWWCVVMRGVAAQSFIGQFVSTLFRCLRGRQLKHCSTVDTLNICIYTFHTLFVNNIWHIMHYTDHMHHSYAAITTILFSSCATCQTPITSYHIQQPYNMHENIIYKPHNIPFFLEYFILFHSF